MATSLQYLLRTGVTDSTSANRINAVINTPIILTPNMFISGSQVNLVDFVTNNCAVYNQTNCTGYRVDSGHISITPTNSTFNFTLTNLGSDPIIYGYALGALITPLSLGNIKTTLGATGTTASLSGLSNSILINNNSQIKPSSSAPYSISEWIGYCHSAVGGVNIYSPNTNTIGYNSNYKFTAGATVNQINYSILKLEIFLNSVSLGYITGSTSYLEYITSVYNNNSYTTTTTGTCTTVCSYYSGSTWYTLNTVNNVVTFTGNPFIATLTNLTINTLTTKLNYSVSCNNIYTSVKSVWIEIQNITQSSSMIITATAGSALASTTTTLSGILVMGVTNLAGDTFIINYSIDGKATWLPVNCSNLQTLPYSGL